MLRAFLITLLIVLIHPNLSAQEIFFANSDFEDLPRHSHTPARWTNCGFVTESPPDIHPDYGINEFKVTQMPYSGQTYLGMVVRANDTWESIGTSLSEPLTEGQCYGFSIHLSRSLSYISGLSNMQYPTEKVNFNTPVSLRIWGGYGLCDKRELLAISPLVENTNWQEYVFYFQPENSQISHIILEAYYEMGSLFPYNGNILLDKASTFTKPADCEEYLYEQAVIINDVEIDLSNNERIEELVTAERANNIRLSGPRNENKPRESAYSLEESGVESVMKERDSGEFVLIKNPLLLQGPYPMTWKNEERMRDYLFKALNDFKFNEVHSLMPEGFFLNRNDNWEWGHPSVYGMAKIFQNRRRDNWEIVVLDADKEAETAKIAELRQQFDERAAKRISIRGYDEAQDEGREWYCMSAAEGLYLARL